MCGAFTLTTYKNFHGFKPRFNIRPSENSLIETEDGVKEARFGLVPPWEKEFKTSYTTFNAKSEGIEKSRLYSRLLKNNRCLIPATGFFEWKRIDAKTKQPMYIQIKNRPLFYFAGLYDAWHRDKPDEKYSFTIITTRPNSFMAAIHDRMPVILEKDEEKPWVEEKEYVDFKKVLDPYPNSLMSAYPVSTLVNRPANDSPAVIERLGS